MANYIKNHSPSACCGDIVPAELWSKRKPSISYFKSFGCSVFVTLPKKERRGKFSPRGKKLIFLGYCDGRRGFRMWDQELKKIITSRDVVFKEGECGWIPSDKDERKTKDNKPESVFFTFTEQTGESVPQRQVEYDKEDGVNLSETEEEAADSVETEESEAEEIEVIEEEEQAEVREEVPAGRQLRERTEKIKPVKYTAVVTSGDKDKEEEEPRFLQGEQVKTLNKKSEKKKRRLERVKQRKVTCVAKNVSLQEKSQETDSDAVLDIFSKYGPA
jgi:hypothetical protein